MQEIDGFNVEGSVSLTAKAAQEISNVAQRPRYKDGEFIPVLLQFLEFNPDLGNSSSVVEKGGLKIVEYRRSKVPVEALHEIDGHSFAFAVSSQPLKKEIRVGFSRGKFRIA